MNEKWKVFLEEDYQKKKHEGIAGYYRSKGVDVPKEGISPLQEWNRDTRDLKFMDSGNVSEAFSREETRQIDQTGCFEFRGVTYEASAAYAGLKVKIVYDPLNVQTVKVRHGMFDVIQAHPLQIGPFVKKDAEVPESLANKMPESSRFLDALEKKYKEDHDMMADALSFGDYGKEGE